MTHPVMERRSPMRLPDAPAYILWTGDGRVRRYATIDATTAAGIGEDVAHIGRGVRDQWDHAGLIRGVVGWRGVPLDDRQDFAEFLGLEARDAD